MPVYGKRPDDVVIDAAGNAQTGATITLHATEADAQAGANVLATATTQAGRWTASVSQSPVWVRTPNGAVYLIEDFSAKADKSYVDTALGGKLDTTTANSTYGRKRPDVIVVTEAPYNAVGDGTTDDTAAWQAAVDACPVGGTVTGQGKTFVVRTVNLKSDMTLRDANFKTKAGATDLVTPVTIGAYSNTTTKRNITIRNVHVDGNRAAQTSIGATEDGGRHGFRLIGAIENLLMEDCSATMCASDGLCIYSGSGMTSIQSYTTGIKKNLRFIRCDFTFNRRHGVSLDCATDVIFEDCRLNDNGNDVGAASTAGELGALLSGGRYGNGIDMEEYSLRTYIGDIKLIRVEAVRNAAQGVLVYEPSGNLANDANWHARTGFDFIDCDLDFGTRAPSGQALDMTPLYANRATGTYFDDVNIENCRITGYVILRSVGTARHRGGKVVVASGDMGIAENTTDLLVNNVTVPSGSKQYSATAATVRYAAPASTSPSAALYAPAQWRTGYAYGPGGALATRTPTVDGAATWQAIYVPNTVSITGIGVDITAAGTAPQVLRLGLWAADGGSGFPGTLIQDAGTVDGSVAGVGWASFTAKSVAPGWYWVGVAAQGGATGTKPTVRTLGTMQEGVPASASATSWVAHGLSGASQTGAFASNPNVSSTTNGQPIFARLRVA